jgi:capsid protein
MEFSAADEAFLRDLVKASRQKHHHVKWVDRDGTTRVTALSQAEYTRLNTLAGERRVGNAELLRTIAHIPLAK